MSNDNKDVIDGFIFEHEAEAVQAAKEADGIRYVKEKTDMNDPKMVLQIYNKMIRQNLFETAVGFAYLKELQEYLEVSPYILKDEILPISVSHKALEESIRKKLKIPEKPQKETEEAEKKAREKQEQGYQKKYRITLFFTIILAVSIAGMFLITANSNNLNILNYENEIINRYAQWEQELIEREEAVKAKETELGIAVTETDLAEPEQGIGGTE